MNLNWKVRFKNPTFIITFAATLLAFVYQLLGLFGVVPTLTQDTVLQTITVLVHVLITAGVLIDPTTPGLNDSTRALAYTTPGAQ